MTRDEMQDVLCEKFGYQGRMISASKRSKLDHFSVFNGNIIVKEFGKIWFGDIDITQEGSKLKNIAIEIGTPIYILRESDARFNHEFDPVETLISKAVWHTNCITDTPLKDTRYEL